MESGPDASPEPDAGRDALPPEPEPNPDAGPGCPGGRMFVLTGEPAVAPEVALEPGVLQGRSCEVYGDCAFIDLHVGPVGVGANGPTIVGVSSQYYESVTLLLDPPRAIEYSIRYEDGIDADGDGTIRHAVRAQLREEILLDERMASASGVREYASGTLPFADRVTWTARGLSDPSGTFESDPFTLMTLTACPTSLESSVSNTPSMPRVGWSRH